MRADKRRPALVVQTDLVREARVRSFLVVPLTSRLHLEEFPGNVRLDTATTTLGKVSVANVYDIQRVLRVDFIERVSAISRADMERVATGVRLALGL